MVMTNEERLQRLREQLEQLNQAIVAIQNGAQEYRIGNRHLKKPDLRVLYQERDRLVDEITSLEEGGGIFKVAVFEGR